MTRRRVQLALLLLAGLAALAWLASRTLLAGTFSPGPTAGPFTADGVCPVFRERYPRCQVRFGHRGLSTLNSAYETFAGEGAFEIRSFSVAQPGPGRYTITAQSNRGPITSLIVADRLVRLGEERENEQVNRTHQASFCDKGRIYEHQIGYDRGEPYVQDLEFWMEQDQLRFRLFQNGSPTADVVCRPGK